MSLAPNHALLHYTLVDKIGEGGMGVVWKAVDTTLDRTVAIKVLPETFHADPERLARFEREAKALAALNNPHIAGIYGLHQVGDRRFIAMEYVEGEDLAQRIARGPLSVEETIAIGTGVADALATAHASGVVHRDLKPANVMLTADGTPKVLDFGLAKAVAPAGTISGSESINPALSPTITSLGTVAGAILGTAAYMSPEQARGNPVDKRADLWALGAILYEMLTGIAPFKSETVSDTLASVLKTDPEWKELPAGTPAALRRVVRRCLEKNPKERMHDAADARIELAHAFDDEPAATVAGAPQQRPYGVFAAIAVIAILGGAALGYGLRRDDAPPPAAQSRIVSTIEAPEGVLVNVRQMPLALSPDGDQLAFVGVDAEGRSHLYVRLLDSGEARRIEGTQGATTPFWSPDSREIGYHASSRVMRVTAEGGTPQVVAEVAGRDGAWARDGTILFSIRGGGLQRVDADGGAVEAVEGTEGGPGSEALSPQLLPDGRHFIFQREDLGGNENGTYLGELGSTEIARLTDTLWNAVWADGHLLFIRDGMLMAQALDIEGRRLTGEPRRVAGPVVRLNYPFQGFFSASPTGGRLAYLHGAQAAGLAEVVWVDREGNELERPGIKGDLYSPRLSHDGRKLAIDMSTPETHGDIWIHDLARGSSRRLTRDPIDESRPIWTPGDKSLVFFRVPDLYEISVSGDSEATAIYTDDLEKYVQDLSPDGRWVLFTAGGSDLLALDRESGEVIDWLRTEFDEWSARFSPDGRWVAYLSNETGDYEVYVDRFPERGERFRISPAGGEWPVWRPDGKELYYMSATRDLMAVPVDMDSERSPIGKPKKLFSPQLRRSYFEISPDGERFLLVERIDPEIDAITLIQNW